MKTCDTCANYKPKNIRCSRCGEMKPADTFCMSLRVYDEKICRACLVAETVAMCGENKYCELCGEPSSGMIYCDECRNKADLTELVAEKDKETPQQIGATIEDGFGSVWPKQCCVCGEDKMEVVRPGEARCSKCDSDPERLEEM